MASTVESRPAPASGLGRRGPAGASNLLRATQGADAEAYQPVGELEIVHVDEDGDTATFYRRALDPRDGVATS